MNTLLVLLVCFGATFAHAPLDSLHDQDKAADNTYPLTSSQYMKWILDRQSVIVDDVLISKFEPASVDMFFDILKIVGLDQAVDIARRVNLKKTILDNQLDSLTLFAPTNDAIQRWREQVPDQANNLEILTKLAKAWIVPKRLPIKYVQNEVQEPTLLENVKLRVNFYDDRETITVNGAHIDRLDKIQSQRTIVNTVDKMIFPLPDGDLMAELKEAGYFSKLVDLIQKAGLEDYIAKTDALTCFAPTDTALAKVPAAKMADLVANKDKLQRVLKYHILISTYYSAGFTHEPIVKSAAGDIAITYNAKGDIELNADPAQPDLAPPKVIQKDIPATNGVIHTIDKILDLPHK